MPQTPDFESLAARLIVINIATIAEQLRQVWNARGTADRAAIDETAQTNWEGIDREAIDRVLRNLDR